MNLVTSGDPWIGSASVSRFATIALRGIEPHSRRSSFAASNTGGGPSFVRPRTRSLPRYDFCRFAPYFDRLCLRPSTPIESSVPRTTW